MNICIIKVNFNISFVYFNDGRCWEQMSYFVCIVYKWSFQTFHCNKCSTDLHELKVAMFCLRNNQPSAFHSCMFCKSIQDKIMEEGVIKKKVLETKKKKTRLLLVFYDFTSIPLSYSFSAIKSHRKLIFY